MNKIRKRIVIVLFILLILAFIILNVIWFDFNSKTKKMLLETSHEMIMDSDSSNIFNRYYSYYDKANGIGYNLSVPGYMNFSCKINVAGTLSKIENKDGSFSYSEDYHVLNVLSIYPLKKYKYQYMIGKANDENGSIHKIVLNSVYVNKNLEIVDIYENSSKISRQEIETLFNNSYETVMYTHNTMLDFFGENLNTLW